MKKEFLILFSITFLSLFLRLYRVSDIPPGLNRDEAAIGYNAYSILTTGRDEHQRFLPLYFESFGDWKLPVYIYLTVPSVAIFGLNEMAVRFPSILFGALTPVVLYLLIKRVEHLWGLSTSTTDISATGLIAAVILAFTPWHLHYSRAAFEVTVALFFYLMGALLIARKRLFLGTFCFLITLYSYNLTRLLSPLLYLLTIYTFLPELKTISKQSWLKTFLLIIAGFIPLFLTFFTNGGVSSAQSTLIFSSAEFVAKFREFRALFPLCLKIPFNNYSLLAYEYFKNFLSYFSIDFLFISGSSHGNHGIGNIGNFYLWQAPFIFLGLCKFLKEKSRYTLFLFSWIFITIAVCALTRNSPHATRSFFLLFPLTVLTATGLKSLKLPKLLNLPIFAFIFFNILYYFSSYYFRFPVLYAKNWGYAQKTISQYVANNQTRFSKVVIADAQDMPYIYLLFYLKIPPWNFWNSVVYSPRDFEGFRLVQSFGKYEFHGVDYIPNLKDVLLVAKYSNNIGNWPIAKKIDFPMRPVVMVVDGQIISHGSVETAYNIIEL